jgi:hypothetical protein
MDTEVSVRRLDAMNAELDGLLEERTRGLVRLDEINRKIDDLLKARALEAA